MIDPKRNQRFWQACGWRPTHYAEDGYSHYDWRIGTQGYHILPDPSDLSFVGYLLRDGLPKVREKCFGLVTINQEGSKHFVGIHNANLTLVASGEAPTLSGAMFNAFEQAMGLDKEEK